MKSNSLGYVAIVSMVMSAGAFAENATVYGKANITLNNYDIESGSQKDNWELESNNSRLGVKGSLGINDSLKAIYKMEFQVNIDDGDSGNKNDNDTFEQRNIYIGLQGDFGTVIAGKHDTPTKLAQGKIDRFNDLPLGDLKNVFEGENRVSNIIMYTTPNLSGFSLTGAIVPGEDDTAGNDDGLADGVSVALKYKINKLSLALAGDNDIDSRDTTRAVVEYELSDYKLGFMYQIAELADPNPGDKEDEKGYFLSGSYKLNENIAIKAQYAFNDIETNVASDDAEKTQMIIGADYAFNKAATVFIYYSNIETDQLAGSSDDKTIAAGYILKF